MILLFTFDLVDDTAWQLKCYPDHRAMDLASVGVVVKSGELEKLTTYATWMGFRRYKPRWIILREDCLAYCETVNAGEKIKGQIPMALVQYVAINTAMHPWGFTVFSSEVAQLHMLTVVLRKNADNIVP